MNVITENNQVKPWYREYFVWFVIFFPALAIVAGIYTIYLAVSTSDGLVVDDYYKRGLEINRTLERDKLASEYGLDADIEFLPDMEEVVLTLGANPSFEFPASLEVRFLNATRAGLDQSISLMRTSDQLYRGHLPALQGGKWYVHIEQGNWRLVKPLVR